MNSSNRWALGAALLLSGCATSWVEKVPTTTYLHGTIPYASPVGDLTDLEVAAEHNQRWKPVAEALSTNNGYNLEKSVQELQNRYPGMDVSGFSYTREERQNSYRVTERLSYNPADYVRGGVTALFNLSATILHPAMMLIRGPHNVGKAPPIFKEMKEFIYVTKCE